MNKTTLFLVSISLLFLLTVNSVSNCIAAESTTETANQDFNLQFKHAWNEEDSNTNNTSFDIASIVGNLTEADFLGKNMTAFVGSQIPTDTFTKRNYQMRLTHMYVEHDGDGMLSGPGDFFLRGWVNQLIDADMSITKNWTYNLGELSDGEEDDYDIMLFNGWAAFLNFGIELYDDDAGSVDTFGTLEQFLFNPTSNASYNVKYDVNDAIGNNATLTFEINITGSAQYACASDILDAYKPYLYFDVETSYQDPATYVFGRVIEGYDSFKSKNTTCLQYLFYYPYEYSGTNEFIHNWDWEMMMIYIDFDASVYPYRLVWDNGFYFTSSQDWIDGQYYKIFENGATPGTYTADVNFSEPLKPLLGDSRQMTYDKEDLTNLWITDYEKWGFFEWGLPTFQATVETSYHQFDIGKASPDSTSMYRNYDIYDFNTTIIKQAYQTLNDSFNLGVHAISGVYTPNYAPFSWDVSQPFTSPYILNNYPKLACDITAFTNANSSKGSSLKVDKLITLILDCPANLNMTVPKSASPGSTLNSALNVHLDQGHAKLRLNVLMYITFSINCFFFAKNWTYTINQTITFDAATSTLTVFGCDLNMGYTGLSEIAIEDKQWGDFITFSGVITPKLIGEIINMELSISIYEILKTFITNPIYTYILDLLIDDFALVINPILSGYMQMDILWGSQKLLNDHQFTTEYSSIPISITVPTGSTSSWDFRIEELIYGLNLKVNWRLDFTWATLPSLFLENQSWTLGTWPNIDIPVQEGTATLTTIAKYNYNSTSGAWELMKLFATSFGSKLTNTNDGNKTTDTSGDKTDDGTTNDSSGIDGFDMINIAVPVGMVTTWILIIKKRKKLNVE